MSIWEKGRLLSFRTRGNHRDGLGKREFVSTRGKGLGFPEEKKAVGGKVHRKGLLQGKGLYLNQLRSWGEKGTIPCSRNSSGKKGHLHDQNSPKENS